MIYLAQADLLAAIGDYLDGQTISSTSYHTTARVIRLANRVIADLSAKYPLREEQWTITGDGSTTEWPAPGLYYKVEQVVSNGLRVPEVNHQDKFIFNNGRLLQSAFSEGWYWRTGLLGMLPVLTSGSTVDVYAWAYCGSLRATVVTGVDTTREAAFTNGDETVTVTTGGVTEGVEVDIGDALTGPDGRVYVVASITDNGGQPDTIELTEPYRGTTVTGNINWSIGKNSGMDKRWLDPVAMYTAGKLLEIEESPRAASLLTMAAGAEAQVGTSFELANGAMFSRGRG